MTIQSGAVVFKFDDPRAFYSILTFIENTPGVYLIYKTMKTNDKLYITSESEMRGDAHE